MNPYDPSGRGAWQSRFPPGHKAGDYTIELGADGANGANGSGGMTVLPDGPHRMFKRRAIKKAMSPQSYEVTWLVGELDGVRCYMVNDASGRLGVVLTKRDLYP